MRVARLLRPLYRLLDRLLWGRLPLPMQRRSKGAVMAAARRLLPGRIPPFSVEALLVDPAQHDPALRTLPEWARSDMLDAALRFAPELNPNAFVARRPELASPPVHRTDAGAAYVALRRQLPDDLDTLFIVPWLTRGGADLGALHYVRACVEEFGHSVAVLATEACPSPWASRLPPEVPFIDAGPTFAALDALHGEPTAVLCRLLLQARPKRIHVVNSRLGWQVMQRHSAALRGFSRLYASLFCDERDPSGVRVGLAADHLRDGGRYLDAVITDNALTPREWTHIHGTDPDLFSVVRFPVEQSAMARLPLPATEGIRPRLLWASRMDRQKRPDVLLEVARRLPGVDIDVHGVSEHERRSAVVKALLKQPNLHVHGHFRALAEIAGPQHLAFLYTSEWDGLPLVLLEAIACGLPVIAPSVGGIPDLLEADDLIDITGDVAEAYVARIAALIADPTLPVSLVERQRARLERHSWARFVQALASTPYYTGHGHAQGVPG